MPLPWIKLWLESLHDPKLVRLSLAERGAWWGLLSLAGECEAGGKLVSGGEPMDIDEIADAMHLKGEGDRQSLESMIAKMETRGSLEWNEGHTLTVVHWEERQRIPPSAKPEAIAERVKKYRERRKETGSGSEARLLPEVGEDEEGVPLVASQEPARDSEEKATGTLKKAGDEEVLAVWSGVKGFPRDSEEKATRFLAELRAEFPDVDILDVSKDWAAAKLSVPLTKGSMPFKQLRAWMKEERKNTWRKSASGQQRNRNRKGEKGEAPPELLKD